MNGIIIINKEKNWTSNDIVQKLKGILHEKIGHTGTLDPLATGVLPILVGKGTYLSKYLVNHDKEYIVTVKLGEKTSTGDMEGIITEKKEVKEEMLLKENIKKALKSFEGKQTQIPPMYSAIKINGKKLYEYARKGQKIEVKPRKIEIYSIELISMSKEKKEFIYKVKCSKGTYIRTLSEDIAVKLETVGFMKELKRIKVGNFSIEQAVKISDIENNNKIIDKSFITIEEFFNNNEKIELDNIKLKKFLNGVKLDFQKEDGVYKIYDKSSQFIGIGELKERKLKRDIVI